MADPWTPTQQDPCPCKFCTGEPVSYPEAAPVIEAPEPRTCTEQDPCGFCGPVAFWDRDPSPVTEPPEPSERTQRAVTGNIPGRGIEVNIISTPSGPGDHLRRIYTATNRKASS